MNLLDSFHRLYRSVSSTWTDTHQPHTPRAVKAKTMEDFFNELSSSFSASQRKVQVSSPAQAMALDTVYRCVDILSGTIASIPLMIQRKDGEIFRTDEGHNLNDIFSCRANERQTFFALMQNAIISYLFQGNAYIFPEYGSDGDVSSLYLLSPNSVNYDIYRNVYVVTDNINGKAGTFDASRIIHLRNKSLDGGFLGVSTLSYASRVLSISATSDASVLDDLGRDNRIKGFVSGGNVATGMGAVQDAVQDTVIKRLEEELHADRSIMRLPGSLSFSPIPITPQDETLLENRKFSPFSICRFFGVHPDMVFVQQSSNYKSSENSQITFLNQTLQPLLRQIEMEFTNKLIRGSRAIRRKYRISFDRAALYTTDLKGRSEYLKASIESGVMTPNEARIMEGRSPIEGGDVTFISCNVAPINSPKIRGEKNQEETTEDEQPNQTIADNDDDNSISSTYTGDDER